MKYLVNSREMKQYDTNTTEHFKVPSLLLMERAALAVLMKSKGSTHAAKISDRLRNGKQWRRWFCTHPAVTFGRSRGAYGVDR